LATYIIEEIKGHCTTTAAGRTGWAYYYFYFGRESDEVPQFLRWIINQLCRQLTHIPPKVRELYRDGGEPATASLMTVLSIILEEFQRVYLILDALDESSNRPNLLNALIKISTEDSFDKLQILATSREELDIKRALEDIATDISLHSFWVDEDIRLYIQNHLCDDRKLNRWPEALKEEIEAALVEGAKGMCVFSELRTYCSLVGLTIPLRFRWAFCQLDILGRLKSAAQIRSALGQLPETLDETYERILDNIPAKDVEFARRAFHLLAAGRVVFTLAQLAEAVIVDDVKCTFTTNDRFVDPDDILEICTCLITLNKGPDCYVSFAHYSVQEYLFSERIKLKNFKASRSGAATISAKIFITYLLNIDYACLLTNHLGEVSHTNANRQIDEAESVFPFLRAAFYFFRFVDGAQDDVVNGLTLKLFSPGRPHFERWRNLWHCYCITHNPNSMYSYWTFPPGAESTATLAYLCYLGLIKPAKALLEGNEDPNILENEVEAPGVNVNNPGDLDTTTCGTPLHIAVALSLKDLVYLLISMGANTKALSKSRATVLNMIRTARDPSIVELLLHRGANPNPLNSAATPLQDVVCRS
jgi:NACHT domain